MRTTLVIVDNPKSWPLDLKGVEVIPARHYLTDPSYTSLRHTKVFNLCRSYRYQTVGYYVSLLAEARGHKPIPRLAAIQDMKLQTMVRFVSEDLDELIQKSLAHIQSERFTLSIYFGKNLAKRYDRLSAKLFRTFHSPLLRAEFIYQKKWVLQSIHSIAGNDIPDQHRQFVIDVSHEFFAGRHSLPKPVNTRYDIAILHNPEEKSGPSNDRALKKFIKAAAALQMSAELIRKDDFSQLAEYDALFIRETTSVNHHTYRFARRAAADGLVVIDDPESILKCTNKVFLAEILQRNHIPTPRTMIVHRDNLKSVPTELGLPCILKKPDSSFSQGVVKAATKEELLEFGHKLLHDSDLIIAQQFLPTDYDWRIGVLDNIPLYACKYYMAKRHWQIIQHRADGSKSEGNVDTLPVAEVPPRVLKTALKAAGLIGNGLYGVDLKQVGRQVYVIEVNDNPSIDAGLEDKVLKDELYRRIMASFLERIERGKKAR
ncbi:RimK family protein [Desulfurivibrio sp. C05AmB]|jgi:glutathione synthase/RimK-type ligase-like ATP-grasp enzyme|uniref:RimK family protein n=1 Tax=Desulfurivibrio sp. C05AmB TaxID=3374371 RepID=UPI00376F3138